MSPKTKLLILALVVAFSMDLFLVLRGIPFVAAGHYSIGLFVIAIPVIIYSIMTRIG